jgi:hypothetical protein
MLTFCTFIVLWFLWSLEALDSLVEWDFRSCDNDISGRESGRLILLLPQARVTYQGLF